MTSTRCSKENWSVL